MSSLESMAIAFLSGLGLALSLYLWRALATGQPIVCISGTCETVLRTSYARVFKVYNSAIGVVFYLALIVLALSAPILPPLADLARLGIIAASVSSLPLFAYLTYIQLFRLRAICEWCLASAAITLLIFAIAAL